MRLIDLLKSDFNHYYFLCDERDFEYMTTYEWEDKKGSYAILFRKKFVDKKGKECGLYDLGYCVCDGSKTKMSANAVAKVLEKSKLFVFDYLEHDDDTMYIHLERKRD